jgi:4'-phosphopantetheinyl transferase
LVVALADAGDWKSYLPDASMLLDAAENLRMQRKRKQGDRDVLILAYALHRLLLGQVLGMDPMAVPLWRDAAGCPRVGDGNIVHTSLSHADGLVALAVSKAGPVGVDVESTARVDMLPEMADSICDPSERVELQEVAVDARGLALLALWVRKEALLKAEGIGLSREMSSFRAPEGEVALGVGTGMKASLRMLEAGPGCLVAVAGPPGGAQAMFKRLIPGRG